MPGWGRSCLAQEYRPSSRYWTAMIYWHCDKDSAATTRKQRARAKQPAV